MANPPDPRLARRIRKEFTRVPIYQDIFLVRRALHKDMARLAPGFRGKLLDVGCGIKPYEALFKNVSGYVGVEYPSTAGSHYADDTRADVWGDAQALPFPAESFDAALSLQLLEHLPEPAAHLNEIFRALKKGGRVLVTAPFAWPLHGLPADYRRFTKNGLRKMLEDAGFRVEELREQGGVWSALFQMEIVCAVFGALNKGGWTGRVMGWLCKLSIVPVMNVAALCLDRLFPWDGYTLSYAALAVKD